MANSRKSQRKDGRRVRTPFGGHRTKLQVKPIKGYVMRWFNDTEDRLQRAEDAGYEYVTGEEAGNIGQGEIHEGNTDLGSRVSKVVSRGTDKPIRAVLMKIKEEWYAEDQEDKEKRNRMVDDAIRHGSPGGNVVENQYVPKGHTQQV